MQRCNVYLIFQQAKSKGKELYNAVARHMSSLGMKSADIFGLSIRIGTFLVHFFAFIKKEHCWGHCQLRFELCICVVAAI